MRAAQYVRMSTERQDYSITNQMAAIESYALLNDFQIVKTYADEGKSGVDLARRPGLKTLLDDVATGPTDFEAILVYDVTRWGRFQDIDESAYYEFLCKRAGIRVHYCAEPFANNDSTIIAMLLKAMKRAMAGEYLRELSAKVFAGQCRIARSGFKIGGKAGYGLRRLLVSRDGTPKQILADGERKSLASDRVVYVAGPAEEVAIVREIYSWFLEEEKSAPAIAQRLNERGVRCGKTGWSRWAINTILNHPKYAGCVVFNQTSRRLGAKNTRNPPDQWIVTPNSFDPLVPKEKFLEVRRRRKAMRDRSDAEMIQDLQSVLQIHGKLTAKTIRATIGVLSPNAYWERFGSLEKLYAAVGYQPPRNYLGGSRLRRKTQQQKLQLLEDLAQRFRSAGRAVTVLNHGLKIAYFGKVGIEAAQPIFAAKGRLCWEVRIRRGKRYRRAIVARMSPDHESVLDYSFLASFPRTKSNFRLTDDLLRNSCSGTAEELVSLILAQQETL
jgi:DNA invertase Pin-like site-specific DNA recombinase